MLIKINITNICLPIEECLFCSVKCTTGKFTGFRLAGTEFGTREVRRMNYTAELNYSERSKLVLGSVHEKFDV